MMRVGRCCYFWVAWMLFALGCSRGVVGGESAPARLARASLAANGGDIRLPSVEPEDGYVLVDAFPGLKFEEPVAIVSPPGETNRLFVLQRTGKVMVIPDLRNPSTVPFLDLTSSTYSDYTECGLLGMAFHPGFQTNGFFFVYRTPYEFGLYDRLSRFHVSAADANRADPDSEVVFISQTDESVTHNAGDIHFGPDGYLYLGIGYDSPAPPDSYEHEQAIDKGLFSCIIRIDVDKKPGNLPPNPHSSSSANYSIPADNPFIGATSFNGFPVDPAKVRTEMYAIGFRNPWRMSIDSPTGRLFCGDVGEGTVEEVNLVEKGGNYGWPFFEGTRRTEFVADPPAVPFKTNIWEYFHGRATNEGSCVIGGLVYRGQAIPRLYGKYIFGDELSGHIWAFDPDNPGRGIEWIASEPRLSTFGVDPASGELLLANVYGGTIRRLAHYQDSPNAPPARLGQTGLFSDLAALEPSVGIYPYDINVTFWSDNAIKRRWFSVPGPDAAIGFSPTENWKYPAGSFWVKHFELELNVGVPESRRRLETRVLVRTANDVYGLTYRWGDSLTDAVLVPPEGMDETFTISDRGQTREQRWHYPGRQECRTCHNQIAGYSLGFTACQLNRDIPASSPATNQLQWLAANGMLDVGTVDPDQVPRLAALTDESMPLNCRVKSFLEANCAACHRPNGGSHAFWDARFNTPLKSANILNGTAIGIYNPGDVIVRPGVVTNSTIFTRMQWDGGLRMPPIGSTVLDTNALDLVARWISSLPVEPWQYEDIGPTPAEGSSLVSADGIAVSSWGAGLGGLGDSVQFLRQTLTNEAGIAARALPSAAGAGGSGGVMVRGGLAADSPLVALSLASDNSVLVQWRTKWSPALHSLRFPANPNGSWLRLLRQGGVVFPAKSDDGLLWQPLVSLPDPAEGSAAYFGLFSGSDTVLKPHTARFDLAATLSVALLPPPSTNVLLPAAIPLRAQLGGAGAQVRKVAFFANGSEIGSATQQPWEFSWTEPTPGDVKLTAVATSEGGLSLTSAPVNVKVTLPPGNAWRQAPDRATKGNWPVLYGKAGYGIPGDGGSQPAFGGFTVVRGTELSISDADLPGLLQVPGGGLVHKVWTDPEQIRIDVVSTSPFVKQVALYFLDWDDQARVQNIRVLDPSSGRVLSSAVVSDFAGGVYLSWAFRGPVTIEIQRQSGLDCVLGGIFFDAVPPIAVAVTNPADGAVLRLPKTVQVSVAAAAQGRPVTQVKLLLDGNPVGVKTSEPYSFTLENLLSGPHVLTAEAVGLFGMGSTSAPVRITASLPAAAAEFVKSDSATGGNWKGVYGSEGFDILGDSSQYPPYASVSGSGGILWVANGYTTDERALDSVALDHRVAAYLSTFDDLFLDVELMDGLPHLVSFYFLDWEEAGRVQSVELRDPVSKALLYAADLADFGGGVYFTWRMRGHVLAKITRVNSVNMAVNGFFFDSGVSGFEKWILGRWSEEELRDPQMQSEHADPDGDGIGNLMEYAMGLDPRVANPNNGLRPSLSGDTFTLSYQRDTSAVGVSLQLEFSDDLVNWTSQMRPQDSLRQFRAGDSAIASAVFQTSTQGDALRFIRLRAQSLQ